MHHLVWNLYTKRATIAIPEELERAIERYRRDLAVASIVTVATAISAVAATSHHPSLPVVVVFVFSPLLLLVRCFLLLIWAVMAGGRRVTDARGSLRPRRSPARECPPTA